jgi:hypothetical protein
MVDSWLLLFGRPAVREHPKDLPFAHRKMVQPWFLPVPWCLQIPGGALHVRAAPGKCFSSNSIKALLTSFRQKNSRSAARRPIWRNNSERSAATTKPEVFEAHNVDIVAGFTWIILYHITGVLYIYDITSNISKYHVKSSKEYGVSFLLFIHLHLKQPQFF